MIKKLILIIIILICVYILYTRGGKKQEKYEDTFGYSTQMIDRVIENERDDPFILAEIQNFNIGDHHAAEELYQVALQDALYNSLTVNVPERVIDRLTDEFIMPAIRVNQEGPEYFDRGVRNDPQNVHDSNITKSFIEKYKKLYDAPGGNYNEKNVISTFSGGALRVYNKMSSDPAFIESLNDTDYGVFQKVCSRGALYPDIYPALNSALGNCIKDGEIVCVTGRISNILDSLTLIDPQIGKPVVTTEILRKDILQDTYNYLQTIPDYEDEEIPAISDKVDEIIREKYAGITDPIILEKLIKEAQAGI